MPALDKFYNFTYNVWIDSKPEGPSRNQLDMWLKEKDCHTGYDYSVEEHYTTEDTDIHMPLAWTYFFDDPKMAVLFKLTWGGR